MRGNVRPEEGDVGERPAGRHTVDDHPVLLAVGIPGAAVAGRSRGRCWYCRSRDDTLCALEAEAGAGCSHGLKGTVNSILRVGRHGRTTQVVDLSSFLMAHPAAHPNPEDFEPDGTWYSMGATGNRLDVVEPNHGEVDVVNPWTGAITRVVDVSASQGHIVPTSLVHADGEFLFGNLGLFEPNSPVPTGV